MSTQAITDYLTKQIFIEKNIVTFRALSRYLSIHVNAAKNELATYHHNAPYQSQSCVATFFLSGTPVKNARNTNTQSSDEDYYMGSKQPTNNGDEEVNDGDEVPQTIVMIVNEKNLEDAKAQFDEVHSIHVYSLSPAPLHDAGLLCPPTTLVRSADKSKGPEFAATVGRIVGTGIKVGPPKKKMAPPPAPIAGPSKSKQAESKPEVKQEAKEKSTAAPEKPKGSGKLNSFFGGPAKPKETKDLKKIKQEEPAPEPTKRMFFSKPAVSKATSDALQKEKVDVPQKSDAPQKVDVPQKAQTSQTKPSTSAATSRATSVSSNKEDKKPEKEAEVSTRGIKRKSSVGLEKRGKSPERNDNTSKAESNTRVRRKVLLSDDEEEQVIPKKSTTRKSRSSYRTDSLENSDAEHDVMKLMDMDDDEVEKVSRVPSTNASSDERDDNGNEMDNESIHAQDADGDVHMSDAPSPKAKVVKKRKPKVVVPVGRNGLKKRKVTKTRRTQHANGYFVKEDYSDWESVASDEAPEEPAPKPKAKTKPKAAVVKKEEQEVQIKAVPATKEVKDPGAKKAPIKVASAPKPKPAAKAGGAKTQQPRLMNFFGPKKTT